MLTTDHIAILAPRIEHLIKRAGAATLEVFNAPGELEVTTKADASPVTIADHRAHQIIMEGLNRLAADLRQPSHGEGDEGRSALMAATAALVEHLPVLSEEAALQSFEERQSWTTYWLIDPLDGTREFVSGNGEYTINIALIHNHEPVAGWVYAPVQATLYSGWRMQDSAAAFRERDGQKTVIHTRLPDRPGAQGIDVVASRRHGTDALAPIMEKAGELFSEVRTTNVGSSLKICLLAAGEADWYPRLAPTSEWDTAAADAVLRGAGGIMVDTSHVPLRYNTGDSILNPHFHAFSCDHAVWRELLGQDSVSGI
ncbi:3'(2'),5'-bisphosphate nucleotidase CysQ family protein [Allohahella marinimesophila]|uniref:3'(2'),5'-bisphosphate nucleotidase CysQ n=1 Tax=Allohahella marinimesophila TaxID=1054972 RepID=A0ABP7PHV5_9GAMM